MGIGAHEKRSSTERLNAMAQSRTYATASGQSARVSFRAQSVLETFCDVDGRPLPEASVDLVHGQKLDILAIWLIVGCALALATWFDAVVASMVSATGAPLVVSVALSLVLRVGADAFSLALVGATYYELDQMTEAQ